MKNNDEITIKNLVFIFLFVGTYIFLFTLELLIFGNTLSLINEMEFSFLFIWSWFIGNLVLTVFIINPLIDIFYDGEHKCK